MYIKKKYANVSKFYNENIKSVEMLRSNVQSDVNYNSDDNFLVEIVFETKGCLSLIDNYINILSLSIIKDDNNSFKNNHSANLNSFDINIVKYSEIIQLHINEIANNYGTSLCLETLEENKESEIIYFNDKSGKANNNFLTNFAIKTKREDDLNINNLIIEFLKDKENYSLESNLINFNNNNNNNIGILF